MRVTIAQLQEELNELTKELVKVKAERSGLKDAKEERDRLIAYVQACNTGVKEFREIITFWLESKFNWSVTPLFDSEDKSRKETYEAHCEKYGRDFVEACRLYDLLYGVCTRDPHEVMEPPTASPYSYGRPQ